MEYKFNKVVVDEMFKCYSVNHLPINGENKLIFAGEGPGTCAIYDNEDGYKKKQLWDNEFGGTMSIVPVKEKEGYFYISKGFYSMVESTRSSINLIKYENGEFIDKVVCYVPYLHRFGVLRGDKEYLIACSIATHKYDKDDWNYPGKIFVGELENNLDGDVKINLNIIMEGLTQNHGYTQGLYEGKEAAFIGTKDGYFAVVPPQRQGDEWQISKLLDEPISDAVYIDLDGDGKHEIVGFTPFHGDNFVIYKLNEENKYEKVFRYEVTMGFYHAIDTYNLGGKPTVFVGARKDAMQLFMVQYNVESGKYETQVIDENVGPANVHVFNDNGKITVMSANRQINQAVLYVLEG